SGFKLVSISVYPPFTASRTTESHILHLIRLVGRSFVVWKLRRSGLTDFTPRSRGGAMRKIAKLAIASALSSLMLAASAGSARASGPADKRNSRDDQTSGRPGGYLVR